MYQQMLLLFYQVRKEVESMNLVKFSSQAKSYENKFSQLNC